MNPDETFDDILRKASEIKTAQMKDKRRAWEASPEFMKNTMTFDKDESYVAMRKSASVAEKIAFAAPIKEEGNELFAKGKYAQAMAKYTAAVAVFRYWNREQSGREQNVVKYYDDDAIADPRRSTRGAKPHSFRIPQRGAVHEEGKPRGRPGGDHLDVHGGSGDRSIERQGALRQGAGARGASRLRVP